MTNTNSKNMFASFASSEGSLSTSKSVLANQIIRTGGTKRKLSDTRGKKKFYRQAKETEDGSVDVLCFTCRRSDSNKVQARLDNFLLTNYNNITENENVKWSCPKCTFDNQKDRESCEICEYQREKKGTNSEPIDIGVSVSNRSSSSLPAERPTLASNNHGVFCSRCRKNLNPSKRNQQGMKVVNTLPIITRLKGYKRLAQEHQIPFTASDKFCIDLMHKPCTICGEKATPDGHGITRLRFWPEKLQDKKDLAKKPYMGPFCEENMQTACGVCNLMKGYRIIQGFVEAARHIATHRGKDIPGSQQEDFGLYPKSFRNNISKRSRSSYITKSSTHTKTHCLTNLQFNELVLKPCHYCGKESNPPIHHNGLDRLDSDNRVYAIDTVVSCCGDCNIMKYKYSEDYFLRDCLKIAKFNRGTVFAKEDDRDILELPVDESDVID